MINLVFNIVAKILIKISKLTKLSYSEINVLVYYFLIPFTWLGLLDVILQFNYLKIAFTIYFFGFYVGCRNFSRYSDWLFNKSVLFLKYFNKFGSNYYASSVWICVSLPLMIYALLIFLIIKQ